MNSRRWASSPPSTALLFFSFQLFRMSWMKKRSLLRLGLPFAYWEWNNSENLGMEWKDLMNYGMNNEAKEKKGAIQSTINPLQFHKSISLCELMWNGLVDWWDWFGEGSQWNSSKFNKSKLFWFWIAGLFLWGGNARQQANQSIHPIRKRWMELILLCWMGCRKREIQFIS